MSYKSFNCVVFLSVRKGCVLLIKIKHIPLSFFAEGECHDRSVKTERFSIFRTSEIGLNSAVASIFLNIAADRLL